jgi:hypothetical protein
MGQIVEGALHPRTFGRGHIGRGHNDPASNFQFPLFRENAEIVSFRFRPQLRTLQYREKESLNVAKNVVQLKFGV